MRKYLCLAAVLALAFAGTVLADDFTGYPESVKVWQGPTVLRVRSGGELQVAGPFAYAGTSAANVTNAAFTLTPTNAWTVLSVGTPITFTSHTTNTGTVTLAVSGLTAKNVYEASDVSALDGGEIVIGGIYTAIYDGTEFQIRF